MKVFILQKLISRRLFNKKKFFSASTSLNNKHYVTAQNNFESSWDRAVSEAIECVNYRSPFLKLSSLIGDKNINFLQFSEKLNRSQHPIHKFIEIFADGKAEHNQIWGIVTLLISKLTGYSDKISWNENDFDKETKILKSQRKLAEYIELMITGNDCHRDGIMNIQHFDKSGTNLDNDSELIFGNKIAILAGDLLLAYSSLQVALLRNHEISGLWGACVRDNVDFNYIDNRDNQSNPLPSDPLKKLEIQKNDPKIFEVASVDEIDVMQPLKLNDVFGTAENEWKLRHTLGGATNLGKVCKASLILGRHEEENQKEAYFLGKHMYLSYRASKDLNIFKLDKLPLSGKFSLVSAPLLFHLETDPSLYREIKKGIESVDNINFQKIHEIVRNGPGIEKGEKLLEKHCKISLELLDKFQESESKKVIKNLILALMA